MNLTTTAGLVFMPFAGIVCAIEISDSVTWHDNTFFQKDTTLFVTDVDDSARVSLEALARSAMRRSRQVKIKFSHR